MPKDLTAKDVLRKRYRALRASLGAEERAQADAFVAMRIQALPAWEKASVVCTYLSVGEEVDTRALIHAAWEAGKLVALPRCVPHSRRMRWYRVLSLEGLERSPFGIEEPPELAANEIDPLACTHVLALVPGLVFDRRGHRLGYGGGFYDGFLARFEGPSVGLAREAQLVDDLRELNVLEAHDQAVRLVASELGVYEARGHA
ncbi:MAG: 5-formyltetrahydrofolate cyclo-ligase [Coriobacteriales bacterium]|nr:5-formyltetrahydrofolate cyclo-ligase [Coriobacteriales bacterium]